MYNSVFFSIFPPQLIWYIFIYPESNLVHLVIIPQASLSPESWQPLICFLSPHICLLWAFHIDGVIQCVVLCVWLLSRSRMCSSLLQHVSGLHSFSWTKNMPLSGYTTVCVVIHQLIDIWVVSIWGSL